MAPLSEDDSLSTAWRALEGGAASAGWRTIPLEVGPSYAVRAGRRLPEDTQAILISVVGASIPVGKQLPKGQGFRVVAVTLDGQGDNDSWLGLYREKYADPHFFQLMAVDLLTLLRNSGTAKGSTLIATILARIRAWQEFMRSAGEGILSPEKELGLIGELIVLRQLLLIMNTRLALEAWLGPLDGLHDFSLGTGAIEVKTTASSGPFLATIQSLDQLDDAIVRPLYLAAVHVEQGETGRSLSELVFKTREDVEAIPAARAEFDSRVLRAGFVDNMAERYTRRYVERQVTYMQINENMPRLTRDTVPAAVQEAEYKLNLEVPMQKAVDLTALLKSLGVVVEWT